MFGSNCGAGSLIILLLLFSCFNGNNCGFFGTGNNGCGCDCGCGYERNTCCR